MTLPMPTLRLPSYWTATTTATFYAMTRHAMTTHVPQNHSYNATTTMLLLGCYSDTTRYDLHSDSSTNRHAFSEAIAMTTLATAMTSTTTCGDHWNYLYYL